MNIRIFNKDLGGDEVLPFTSFKAAEYEFSAEGGPSAAVAVAAAFTIDQLEQAKAWLLSPVQIEDTKSDVRWWGFVEGVFRRGAGGWIGYSLDKYYNEVAVRYGGTLTAWAAVPSTERSYADKQSIQGIATEIEKAAEEYRDMYLEQVRYPNRVYGLNLSGLNEGIGGGALVLRGWWDTLGWQNYENETLAALVDYSGVGSTTKNVGDNAARVIYKQTLTMPASTQRHIRRVRLWLMMQGYCDDNVVVRVLDASDNQLGSATLDGDLISTSALTAYNFDFSRIDVAPGAVIKIQVNRSGGIDAANYYQMMADSGGGYAGGALTVFNGTAWVANADDLQFTLSGTTDTDSLGQADTIAMAAGLFSAVEADMTGVSIDPYRVIGLASEYVRDILMIGDGTNPARAWVDQQRKLVFSDPTLQPEYTYDGENFYKSYDGGLISWPVSRADVLPGRWARWREVPRYGETNEDLGLFKIERTRYEVAADRLMFPGGGSNPLVLLGRAERYLGV